MSSQSQKSQALLSLWGHLVLTSIAKQTHTYTHIHTYTHTHTHTHTHTCWFCYTCGDSHRRNGFCTVQTVYSIALHQPYT